MTVIKVISNVTMKNVLVCVTQQRSCERLIRYGKELVDGTNGELVVLHIAQYDLTLLGETKDAESLEYLYQKSVEYGAIFMLVRSGNVPATLASMIKKQHVSIVVMGETRHSKEEDSTTTSFKDMLHENVEVIVVPDEEDAEDDV